MASTRAKCCWRTALPPPISMPSPLPAPSAFEGNPMTDELLYEIQDGIGRITFNRPAQRNAFTFAMYERLAEVCSEIETDTRVKALVLTGAGDKAFAAGTDI